MYVCVYECEIDKYRTNCWSVQRLERDKDRLGRGRQTLNLNVSIQMYKVSVFIVRSYHSM